MNRETFFTHDRQFYATLFPLLATLALQNLIAYSVNMLDNVMLGAYGQTSLSGAATVNQVFFVVQQFALAIGDGLVVLGSQYWGQGRTEPIRRLTGIALRLGLASGVVIVLACGLCPAQLVALFTNDAEIIAEGVAYLTTLKWTFLLFIATSILMAALRSVEVVRISFWVSSVSLVVNGCLNYALIFGRLGLPEMGIRGAAVGTLAARVVELAIILWYLLMRDDRLRLFSYGIPRTDPSLRHDYARVEVPLMVSQMLWAITVPLQTAILGHLSSDAIAANSVATTFYSYLKVVVQAMSAASAVMIGTAIGRGDLGRVKSDARTLSAIDLAIGAVLAFALIMLRAPLLSVYSLSETALSYADSLIVLMSGIMVGMSYQMPVSMGIIRGAGDVRFAMVMNLVSVWLIVMPLSFMAAFVWRWPIVAVVAALQSDQVFKCVPTFLRFRSYKWVKELTRPTSEENV